MTIKIKSLPFEQGGYKCFMCIMKASELLENTSTDTFDPALPMDSPRQGYQALENLARVKRLANYFRKENRPTIPSSVVLSCRAGDLNYDQEKAELVLNNEEPLIILDGQRRIDALRYAIIKKGLTRLLEYQVPVVIFNPENKLNEMQIFQTLQSTQKAMRTDLVSSMLAQAALKKGVLNMPESERWKIIITEAISILNDNRTSPWYHRIIKIGEPRNIVLAKRQNREIVRTTSFISSLKPVYNFLAELGFLKGSISEQAAYFAVIIDDFWMAIEKKAPNMFKEANNYVLQKSTGIFALHLVLRDLLNEMFREHRGWTLENFELILDNFPSLTDPSFWYIGGDKGPPGEANHFGSMKGFRKLADILLEEKNSFHSKRIKMD
jgi:DGQHR domain-containing protein